LTLLAALLLAAGGCSREAAAPAPPALADLTRLSADNAAEFGRAFDEGADRPRLVLLLSPT
jgi:hypothetical protein